MASASTAAAMLTRSFGCTPKSRLDMNLVPATAPAIPSDEAGGDEQQRVPDDDRHHPAAAGAERGAHADLVRPLRHRVSNHAKDADPGQQERENAEPRDEPCAQTIGAERLVPDVLDGPHLGQRLIRVDLERRGPERGHHVRRGTRRADNHARGELR